MLRFFRRIRQSLLGSGQTRKYVLYAIGEFVLIVAGILVAMQINNWNENRIQQKQVKTQLLNLQSALQLDINSLENGYEISAFRFNFIEYFLGLADESPDELPHTLWNDTIHTSDNFWIWPEPYPDSLNRDFLKTGIHWLTTGFASVLINYSALNELNSTGLFAHINNQELKKKITEYYRTTEWSFSNRRIEWLTEIERDLDKYFRDKHNLRTWNISERQDPVQLIQDDRGGLHRLQELRYLLRFHYMNIVRTKDAAQKLVDMINHEISN